MAPRHGPIPGMPVISWQLETPKKLPRHVRRQHRLHGVIIMIPSPALKATSSTTQHDESSFELRYGSIFQTSFVLRHTRANFRRMRFFQIQRTMDDSPRRLISAFVHSRSRFFFSSPSPPASPYSELTGILSPKPILSHAELHRRSSAKRSRE